MKILYQNWSTHIFMGFYESPLFNSDTEYYLNETFNDNEDDKSTWEVDFEPYQQAISSYAVELLKDYCITDDNIIKSMKYKYLYSPKYYNFDTDRLNIEINFNLNKLKKYIKNNIADFNMYLKDNFTSYDGFISFVSNNYIDFVQQYKKDKELCINTMLEYYILRHIYADKWEDIKQLDYYEDTPYHQELFENNQEAIYNYAIQV